MKRYYDAECHQYIYEDGRREDAGPIKQIPWSKLYPEISNYELRREPFIVGALAAVLFLMVFIYCAETAIPELKDIQLLAVLAAVVIGQAVGLFTAGIIKLLDL